MKPILRKRFFFFLPLFSPPFFTFTFSFFFVDLFSLLQNETFLGFPWVLRLRYIMENGNDLSSALELWGETNNTIGYNHMIAFQDPSGQYNRRSAVALETGNVS